MVWTERLEQQLLSALCGAEDGPAWLAIRRVVRLGSGRSHGTRVAQHRDRFLGDDPFSSDRARATGQH